MQIRYISILKIFSISYNFIYFCILKSLNLIYISCITCGLRFSNDFKKVEAIVAV